MDNTLPTTATSSSRPELLQQLFEQAEARFPPRFREHGWYLTMIAALIGSGQQRFTGELYKHLISQPQYQTSSSRQALVRRLREAMVKCVALVGVPSVIEAVTMVAEQENPEDKDFSCSRENWQVGPETTERATNLLKMLYKSEVGGTGRTVQAFQAHRDVAWITLNITYGLYLSDTTILSTQETELVVLPAVMMQNLREPTYWHLRASLRVGIEPEEVEAVYKVIELVAAYGWRVLDVPRVGDVDDA